MSKVRISRSIEGEAFSDVILDRELVVALAGFNQATESFVFLLEKGWITDDLTMKFKKDLEAYESVFRKYNLNKYEVRANYKFEESQIIE
jgi:hypothetical protein